MRPLLLLTVSVSLLAAAPAAPTVEFPRGYRTWVHSKSMVIPDKSHGLYGFHHVYVEPKALEAYKKAKDYPDGARLVVPFHDVKNEGGMVQEGPLLAVAVMQRDAKATETGGWRWAMFEPNGQAKKLDVQTACVSCHTPKKDRAWVFSEWVEPTSP